MSIKTLFLITNYYPFYKGEEYIESEIEYLSSKFDKIVLIPTMVDKKMKITRELPKNVQVIHKNYNLKKLNKLFFALKPSKKEKIKRKGADSVTRKFYVNYFENRSKYIFNKIFSDLEIENYKYDEIYIYSYWLYVTARVAIFLKELLEKENINVKKAISRAHRYDLYENEAYLSYLPEREYLLKKLDKVYACSHDGELHLNRRYERFNSKIRRAYLGTEAANNIKRKKSSDNLIVSCSGVREVKRINKIIDSLVLLEQRKIKYKWIHFGDGTDFFKVLKYARQNLSEENYCFKGNMSNKDIKDWYDRNNVDIFINVSQSEGLPVSIMEAMARGIPIIATDVGGSRELISKNGILLDVDCGAEEVSLAIESILTCNEYDVLCNNSYNLWESRFNSKKNYQIFSNLLIKENSDEIEYYNSSL